MKRMILILVLAIAGWYGWGKYQAYVKQQRHAEQLGKSRPAPAGKGDQGVSFFRCDNRTQCKQLTSCEEAKYFIKNCPGFSVEVLGEDVPCEQQWCRK
jgi:predicted negative regulator of RcsB-dependent stress response